MNKDIKRRIENYALCDRDGIAAHLGDMAAQGWLLQKIGQFFWEYRRVEPQTLHFAVTCFPEASDFDPRPGEPQQTYWDYCRQAGWELAATTGPMQIFYTAQPDPVPVETEPAAELQTLHRAMKKTLVGTNLIWMVLALLQLCFRPILYRNDPVQLLSDATVLYSSLMWLLLLAAAVYNLTDYYRWYRRCTVSVTAGGPCLPYGNGYRLFGYGVLVLVLLLLGLSSASLGGGGFAATLAGMAMVGATLLITTAVKRGLKRAGVSRRLSQIFTILTATVAAVATMAVLVAVILMSVHNGLFQRQPVEIIPVEYGNGQTWDYERYEDALPLTLEDLGAASPAARYSYELRTQASPLVITQEATQDAIPDGGEYASLRMELVDVRCPLVYDWVLSGITAEDRPNGSDLTEEQMAQYTEHWELVDDSRWNADAVYWFYTGENLNPNRVVVCWGSRIVTLYTDWVLTDAQVLTAAQALKK